MFTGPLIIPYSTETMKIYIDTPPQRRRLTWINVRKAVSHIDDSVAIVR